MVVEKRGMNVYILCGCEHDKVDQKNVFIL